MQKLRIAIAIPTYNRVDKLKFAFSKIEEQIVDRDVEIICVICNTASTDGTHDYLSTLTSKKVSVVIHSSLENSIFINWAALDHGVPPQAGLFDSFAPKYANARSHEIRTCFRPG